MKRDAQLDTVLRVYMHRSRKIQVAVSVWHNGRVLRRVCKFITATVPEIAEVKNNRFLSFDGADSLNRRLNALESELQLITHINSAETIIEAVYWTFSQHRYDALFFPRKSKARRPRRDPKLILDVIRAFDVSLGRERVMTACFYTTTDEPINVTENYRHAREQGIFPKKNVNVYLETLRPFLKNIEEWQAMSDDELFSKIVIFTDETDDEESTVEDVEYVPRISWDDFERAETERQNKIRRKQHNTK